MNRTKIFILIVLLTASTQVLARILYVKAGSTNPVAPYLTPETASDSIRKATRISVAGDTIYLLNGTYNEQVLMKPSTSLIGQSRAGAVIELNFAIIGIPTFLIEVEDYCVVKNLTITTAWAASYGDISGAIGSLRSNSSYAKHITIDSVFVDFSGLIRSAIAISSGKVTNSELWIVNRSCFLLNSNTGWPAQDTLLLEVENVVAKGISRIIHGLGSVHKRVKIKNSSFRGAGSYTGDLMLVLLFESQDIAASFINCLIEWGETQSERNSITSVNFNLDLENCTLAGRRGTLFDYYSGKLNVKNTLFYGPAPVIKFWNQGPVNFKYNFFSNSSIPAQFDSTNINGCNSRNAPEYNYYKDSEWRLDMFSEAIDKGDPALKDADGSRSDIGAAGGPGGFSYTYPDLAPVLPDTVWATTNTTTGKYHLFWRNNCEKDLSRYKVYGDGVANTTCGSSAFLGETTTPAIATDISRFPSGPPYVNFIVYDTAGNMNRCQFERPPTIGLTATEKEDDNAALKENLQVYPNPTNGMITVMYRITGNCKISLSAVSVTGEETAEVLCNESRQAGTYTQQVQLNGASGVYIVRLVVVNSNGEKKEYTQKVSLVK